MLAELAAANAAYKIIATTIKNGRELMTASKAISNFVDAKDSLHAKANKDKNSFWNKARGVDSNDLESFLALEEVNQKQKEIEQAMIYYGRPGLHGDWVRFQVERRKARQKAQADALKRKKELIELLGLIAVGIVCAAAFVAFAYFVWFLYKSKHGG